jgi:hypothetical protein
VKSISVPIAGIVASAFLDNRLSWRTMASLLVALYCHRLYRRVATPVVSAWAWSQEDELRPGWAARWGVSGWLGADGAQPDSGEVG